MPLVVLTLLLASQAAAQPPAYRIGVRDVISIEIYAGGESQYKGTLTVSENGTINAPFIGNIAAAGLTPSELEKRITDPLAKDYFVNPKVNLAIKEYHSLQYYISGAVRKPGLYETDAEVSLLELIAKAEGVTAERGSIAYILRNAAPRATSGESIPELTEKLEPVKIDLQRLLDQADLSINPRLTPGDVVYIPPQKSQNLAESKIYVEGEVKTPGIYDYQAGMTAMNACILAGGFARFAAPNRTQIVRNKGNGVEIIKIDLEKVKEGKMADIPLSPGDRIHIPETWF